MTDDIRLHAGNSTVPPTSRDVPTGTVPRTSRDVPPQCVPPTGRDVREAGLPPTSHDSPIGAPSNGGADGGQEAFNLPGQLAERYRRVPFRPRPSGEADLYRLEALATGEQVMLKWYRPGINPKSEVLERVSRSDPDHVVRLIEHGQIADRYGDSRYYEILEYAPHGSLHDLIVQVGPRLDEKTAREVLTEIAGAVGHLHRHRIVHRDIKPGNILVRQRHPLDLILTDFGIASVVDSSSHMTSFKGTCAYISPEAMAGQVSPKSDYWSIGMILLEILTGTHPFRLANGEWLDDQRVKVHIATRGIDVSAIEGRWQRLCRGLLLRDPASRWGEEEVRRWLDGEDRIELAEDKAPGSQSPPLRIAGRDAQGREFEEFIYSPRDLAPQLALHWEQGKLKLERGDIGEWLRRYWGGSEPVLIARVDELERERNLDADSKLFRLLIYLEPQGEPTFRGYSICISDLAVLAEAALQDNAEAAQLLTALFELRILSTFGRYANNSQYAALEERWRADLQEFEALRTRIQAEDANRSTALPTRERAIATLLLGRCSEAFIDKLRRSAIGVSTRRARKQDWFKALGDPDKADLPGLLAIQFLAAVAEQQTRQEHAGWDVYWGPLALVVAVVLAGYYVWPKNRPEASNTAQVAALGSEVRPNKGSPVVGYIQNAKIEPGCSCEYSVGDSTIFVGERGCGDNRRGAAVMNIDGRDEMFAYVGGGVDCSQPAPNNPSKFQGNGISAQIHYLAERPCTYDECEVTGYDVRITVKTRGGTASVPATGTCGC